MPKKKPVQRGTNVSFRAPDDLAGMLDAEVDRVRAERKGAAVSRSSVMCEILYRALAKLETT